MAVGIDTDSNQLKAVVEAAGAEILFEMATAMVTAAMMTTTRIASAAAAAATAMAGATDNNQLLKRGRHGADGRMDFRLRSSGLALRRRRSS